MPRPGPPFDASKYKGASRPGRDNHHWVPRFVKGRWKWSRTNQVVKTKDFVSVNQNLVGVSKIGQVVIDDDKAMWASVNGTNWSLVNEKKVGKFTIH